MTDEQIEQAKAVDILDYLMAHEKDNLVRQGPNRYILREHDSFVISNGKWCWNSRGYGCKTATALNYLTSVREMAFTDAVALLTGDALAAERHRSRGPPPAEPPKPFVLPEKNANNDRAVAYLRGRGIDRDILHYCIRAGILYESRAYHNCVFVGQDEQGTARFACVRGTWGDFRLDIESSQKRYSFHLSAAMEEARDLLVAEAPIDILSLATLHKLEGRPWQDQHYLSLGGVAPVALRYYLYRHRSIDRVQLCLDSDEAGRKALCNITDALFRDPELAGRKLTVSAQPPPLGKDWNDTLRAVAQEKTEQQKLGRSSNRAALSI